MFRILKENRLYLFRLILIAAIVVHFLPSFLAFSENYLATELRANMFNHFLFVQSPQMPLWLKMGMATLLGISLLLLCLPKTNRIFYLVTAIGLYFFLGINALNTNAFFVPVMFFLLLVFAGLAEHEQGRMLRFRNTTFEFSPLRHLILFTVMTTVMISGIEKIHGGWFEKKTMELILAYPPHSFLREWVYSTYIYDNKVYGFLGSYFVPILEIISPLLALLPKTRKIGSLLYALMFVGIFAITRVPLAFILIYLGILVLVPSQKQWQHGLNALLAFLKKNNQLRLRKIPPPKPQLKTSYILLAIFLLWQLFFPLRHFLIKGDVHFTREGEWFSWRVMSQQAHECYFAFYRSDNTKIAVIDNLAKTNLQQLASEPYLIFQLAQKSCAAHRLKNQHLQKKDIQVVVRSEAMCRMDAFDDAVFIIDPRVNLCEQEYSYFKHNDFIFSDYKSAQDFSRYFSPQLPFDKLKEEYKNRSLR